MADTRFLTEAAGPWVAAQFTTLPPVTPGMLLVLAIAAGAFALFVTESVRVDVTALSVAFALMLLGRWTGVTPTEGLSGFSSEATIVVLAMFILSAGVRRTGAVQRLAEWMSGVAGVDERRQLLVTVGVAGLPSGLVNNTPMVAMLIPAVTEMARRTGTSPSKLLMPLSYASILGGTLTLVGTTSNLLASSLSRRLIGRRLSMFEFTQLGLVVFVTGMLYLFFVGRHLIPERLDPDLDPFSEYELSDYLTGVVVAPDSPFVGAPVRTLTARLPAEADLLRVTRDGESAAEPTPDSAIRADDAFVVRTDVGALRALTSTDGLSVTPAHEHSTAAPEVAGASDGADRERDVLVELVIPSVSTYLETTIAESPVTGLYDATVLAIRRSGDVIHRRLEETTLRGGDTLLVQVAESDARQLAADPNVVVVQESAERDYRTGKTPHALGIVVAVVALAALGVVDLVVGAIGGVVAMVLAGVLDPEELYDAVDWSVVFLLAGIIPLGVAFQDTGAADFAAALVVLSAEFLPPLALLWVFYLVTVALNAFISNAGSVVLMLPIAVEAAARIGADPFVFVLAVMFAASADFMTPVGYQTNLLVYGPGGYEFTDYVRVGAPLQLLLSVVTVVGLDVFWGV